RSATLLVWVDSAELGVKAAQPVPDYDGCAEWGGFEEDQIAYLARHDRSGQRRWIPRISSDAHDGRQSAILPEGKTVLAPILSTAKIAHRFSCWMKADKPVDVTVQLAEDSKSFRIGTGWTRVDMTLTPANTL